MTGADILERIARIAKLFEREQIPIARIEFEVAREEWSDVIRHMHYYGGSTIPFDTLHIDFHGIRIYNPDYGRCGVSG